VRWYGDELGFNHVEEAIGSVLAQTWKAEAGSVRDRATTPPTNVPRF